MSLFLKDAYVYTYQKTAECRGSRMHKFNGIGLGEKLSFWFSAGEHDEKVSIHVFVDS